MNILNYKSFSGNKLVLVIQCNMYAVLYVTTRRVQLYLNRTKVLQIDGLIKKTKNMQTNKIKKGVFFLSVISQKYTV